MRKITILLAIFLSTVSIGMAVDYTPPELDSSAVGGDSIERRSSAQGSDEGGKTVGAGQISEIIELAGDDSTGDRVSEVARGIEKGQVKRGMVVARPGLYNGEDKWVESVVTAAKKGDRVALIGFLHGGDCDDTRGTVHPRCDVPIGLVMNKAELIDSIASEADITKADAKKALDAFIDTTTKARKDVARDGGQPSFDDLEMERGYLVIKNNEAGEEYFVHATGLIDEIRDDDEVSFELVRAGAADSARKEIAVKMQNEEGTELKDATMGNRAENYKDFTVSKRSARKGRNPQTGKEIKIPAKKVVKFKPGAELADKVKRTGGDNRDRHFHGIDVPAVGNPGTAKEGRKGMNAVNVQRTAACCDDADGDGFGDVISELATSIEKEDVKRGMIVARVATGENVPNGQPFLRTETTRVGGDGKPGCCFDYTDENSISKRSARKGRNPQTGKEIKIPAKKVVRFKPGAELADKVK